MSTLDHAGTHVYSAGGTMARNRIETHKRWKNVRLTEQTYERLVEAIKSIEEGVEAGRLADPGLNADPINPLARGLSFDAMIALLLDRRDQHAERARRSAKNKKGGGDV